MDEIKKYLIEFGYDEKGINKITSSYQLSHFIEDTLVYNIKEKNKFLLDVGYTKEEIISMSTLFPAIYSYKVSLLNNGNILSTLTKLSKLNNAITISIIEI